MIRKGDTDTLNLIRKEEKEEEDEEDIFKEVNLNILKN